MYLIFRQQLKEYEGKETAQLVDRYKFLDLYPCTSTELKSIGYAEVSNLSSMSPLISRLIFCVFPCLERRHHPEQGEWCERHSE